MTPKDRAAELFKRLVNPATGGMVMQAPFEAAVEEAIRQAQNDVLEQAALEGQDYGGIACAAAIRSLKIGG